MVDTRSSPRRRKPGGRPPLPTNKKKANPKAKKKAPSKVTKAAKQQVVEEAGKVYIKPDPELKPGGHFTEEEDIYICKAWVSCTTDAIVGAQQKGEKFFKSVSKTILGL